MTLDGPPPTIAIMGEGKSVFSGVLLALIVFFVVVPVVAVVSCVVCAGTARGIRQAQERAASASAAAAVPASASAEPIGRVQTLSIAMFTKHDELAVCLDISANRNGGALTAQDRAEAIARANAADAGSIFPGMSQVVLQDTCETAFAGRPVLASCAFGPLAMSYYSFDALKGDADMRDCMRGGGRWTELPHDSPEYRAAKAQHEIEKLGR